MQAQKELRNQAVGKIDWIYQGVDLVPCLNWDPVLSSMTKVVFLFICLVFSLSFPKTELQLLYFSLLGPVCNRAVHVWDLIGLQRSSWLLVETGQEGEPRARILFIAKL